ncbi:MAG TPA: hypothetical protein VMY06_07715 [Sedimentisphaerales bacterium]|nr:hypothetical protein [Sedimentisphaerales bacterium]
MNDKIVEKKTGVSLPAVSMARAVDRLPPGDYIIKLVKPIVQMDTWDFEVLHTDLVKSAVQKEINSRTRKR